MPKRTKHVPWLVLGLVLFTFASAIALVTFHLRGVIRGQIVQQDGIMLYAASLMEESTAVELGPELAEDPELRFTILENRALEAATLRGVIAVRLYDTNGHSQFTFPQEVRPGELGEEDLALVREFRTTSRFNPDANLLDYFHHVTNRGPILRAVVPLREGTELAGAAEFILSGKNVAVAFAGLDRDLWLYAALIFAVAGGITAVALIWAFRRLQTANELLGERTRSLLRANHELTLSAKTSAIGAITAHLIHDLKSPLFGLQTFVSARGSADDEDWEVAIDTTQRMQKIISDIVRILQEEKTSSKYELTLEEVFAILRTKMEPEAQKAGVDFQAEGSARRNFINRDANVILLLLTNLLHNALQATPKGGRISVAARMEGETLHLEVSDTGPGLPKHVLETLFTPSRSTKTGGTGLGLAISKQLANHIGADLTLKETSPEGTTFRLCVPETEPVAVSELATE